MDYLCQCNSDRDRREALKQLPPDLPSSYERILVRVNKSSKKNQRLVIRTLTWLLHAKKVLNTGELLQALAVEDDESDFDRSAMSTEEDLLHWCSSLIRRRTLSDSSPGLEFAHFTVKEYLLTLGDIDNLELSKYYLSKDDADVMLGRTCLTFLNYDTFGTCTAPNSDDELLDVLDPLAKDYNFLSYAAFFWDDHALLYMHDEMTSLLVGKLLAPVPSNQFRIWRSFRAFDSDTFWYPDDSPDRLPSFEPYDTNPLHWAACFGLEDVCERLLKYGVDVNSASGFGNPLCCAILGINAREKSVHDLDNIIEFDLRTETEYCDSASIVKLLASAGADIEKKEYFYMDQRGSESELSPLSLAIRAELGKEPKIVQALIDCGANPSAKDVDYVIENMHEWGDGDPQIVEALYACAAKRALQQDTRESVFRLALNDSLDRSNRHSRLRALEICGVLSEGTYKEMLEDLKYSVEWESLEALKIISKVVLNGDPGLESARNFLRNLVLPFIKHRGIEELEDLLQEDLLTSCKDKDGNAFLHLTLLEARRENLVKSPSNSGRNEADHYDKDDTYESGEDDMDESDEIEDYADKEIQILSLVRILLKRGENIATRNNHSETALHLVAQQRSLRLFRLVYDAANSPVLLRDRTNEGRTPLWYAINSESERIVEFLIKELDQFELYLDQDGALPQHDPIPIMIAAKNHKWKVVSRLIGCARDDTILLSQAVQIFLYAAEDGATEILELLVDEFPDLDIETRDETGATPLLLAAQRSQNLSTFEFLLECGANLTTRCDSGTVAHFAVSATGNGIREQLLSLGIIWNTKGKCMAKSGGLYDGSPLHKAAAEGRVSAIKFLLSNKLIDPNLESSTGVTPLGVAIQWNQRDAARTLLDNGSFVDNRDAHGRTPLHLAAGLGCKEITETLLEHGSDARIRDLTGCTPKDHALNKGHAETAGVIQSAIDKQASIALLKTLLHKQDRPKTMFTFYSHQPMTSKTGDSVDVPSLPIRLPTRNTRKSCRAINGRPPKSPGSTVEAVSSLTRKPPTPKSLEPTIFRIDKLSPERVAKCYSRLANQTTDGQKEHKRKEGDMPTFLVWTPEEILRDTENVQETPFVMLYKDLEPVLGGVVRAVAPE
jgi:ankyrin repeat protein